jgi:ankyrin repeat protein
MLLQYGATPLIIAITNGHKEVVKILLDAGSDYSELKTPDRNSPLHEAAFCDEPEILNLVLEKIHSTHSPDGNQQNSYLIDLTNQFGNTPLHNAACAGSEECVRLLLKNDAKYNIKNIVRPLIDLSIYISNPLLTSRVDPFLCIMHAIAKSPIYLLSSNW